MLSSNSYWDQLGFILFKSFGSVRFLRNYLFFYSAKLMKIGISI